ncbi:lipopolysaccharide biosynthesis protein [Methylomonas sp. 11b]|uniref:lipopolysaccharide biosynthesis protein n=1 Tax=Methylomonas sp. 11b TaxID=1168169 RepID=UPI0009DD8D31|nr:lipopolysaccharide biosynthesis protein [Methylomonas sp. 11b]
MSKIKSLVSGIGWGTFSTVTVVGFQLVFMAIMARLLEPANFGLVAIANVSLRFFGYFAQMGTAPALIQKPKLEDGDIAAALTVSLGISCLFFGVVQIATPYIEVFFQMDGLGLVIRGLSINFIIGGFSAVSMGLLRRDTAFRAISIIEIVSYVFGYGLVGIGAAYHGLGVWALVAAFMTQSTLTAIFSYAVKRHSLSLRHTAAQRRHFFSYGGRYSLIGFTEFLSSNLDALLIGKLLGAAPAGYYNRALLLANLPVQQPANILTKVLFPIMSSVSDQHDKQIISLQLSTLLVGSYAFAVGSGIFVSAPDIVKVLLGSKWLDSIPILEMLSWSVGPLYISHVAGVTLDSMNKLRIKLRIQVTMLVFLVALMLWLAPTGRALDIATAVVVTEWVRVGVMAIKLTRVLRIPVRDVALISVCIVIIALASGAMIQLIIHLIGSSFNIQIRLVAEIFAGGAGLLFGAFIVRYIAVHLSAIRFLAGRSGVFSKFLPKYSQLT